MIKPGRYAAIDIGTVTCRLLIADVDSSGLHELDRGYGITNLGEGVDATSRLKPEAMERVGKQLELFNKRIASYQNPDEAPIVVTAMATSASRDAENSNEFLELLDQIGIHPQIIPGAKEAALSFAGVSSDFSNESLLVVDIGGGSTEISVGASGSVPTMSHSFDVGCRRVTERFLPSDPPAEDELVTARHWIESALKEYFNEIEKNNRSIDRMVAVAGTATSVVSVYKKMEVYDTAQVHRSIVGKSMLVQVYDQMRSVTLEQRKKIVGLDPGRAGVIVAGLMILEVVMDLCGVSSFTVSESDILQGIILDTATKLDV